MFISNFRQTKPKIFFIGIGGVSMSALAKYLIINGFSVFGSDKVKNDAIIYLEKIGCKIYPYQDKNNIVDCDIIIYNSAINENHPELAYARELNKCIIKRVELLQMIASSFDRTVGICGSHGKTTSCSILAHILFCSDLGFTSHIGGFDSELGNLYQTGKRVFLTEVCEFDKNINKLTTDLACALNIDMDHMNSYKNFNELKQAFFNYLDRANISIVNIDDENLLEYSKLNKFAVTYSLQNIESDYFAKVINQKNGLIIRFFEKGKKLFDVKLNLFGYFNAYNCLCAVAISRLLEIPIKSIIEGLKGFKGVKRRNELVATINGCKIIADYGHHPKEIESIYSSYKNLEPYVIFQPHTYSRTKFLFKDFIKVLRKIPKLILYKTYPAREEVKDGLTETDLANQINCKVVLSEIEIISKIKKLSAKNKVILVLGAGDLYDIIYEKLKTT